MKVLLVLVDGMRPDSLTGIEYAQDFLAKSTYTLNAKTVLPSDTLPCHMSLFHSVDPEVHKTNSNTFNAGANPVNGLCEVLSKKDKKCAFFFAWGELRDLAKPGTLTHSCFVNGNKFGYGVANEKLADFAIDYLAKNDTDFTFLYFGYPDDAGHRKGWMSEEYILAVKQSLQWANKVVNTLSDDYTVIITADHGGHDYGHGTDMPEDRTIPIMIMGKDIPANKEIFGASIKDIAPTVTKILGVEADGDWTGKSLL